jgi:RNA-binding protein 25
VETLIADIIRASQDAASSGLIDKEKYVIPPHLHDLQEADLPETQRGLVISEIAQFRERAAKREREKMKDVRDSIPSVVGMLHAGGAAGHHSTSGVPSGPKVREWGKPQHYHHQNQRSHGPGSDAPERAGGRSGFGSGAQGYSKPVGFVRAEDNAAVIGVDRTAESKAVRSDEQLEEDRKEVRRRDEEVSFKDVRPPPFSMTFLYSDRFPMPR